MPATPVDPRTGSVYPIGLRLGGRGGLGQQLGEVGRCFAHQGVGAVGVQQALDQVHQLAGVAFDGL